MHADRTALLLIGYQNDYFAPDGALHHCLEDTAGAQLVLERTVSLLEALAPTGVVMVSTPIRFTANYDELTAPVGILRAIRDAGAFRANTEGSKTVDEFAAFGDRITVVEGKRGLNAFSNTELASLLVSRGITDVAIAGAVTSICIDSAGRAAHELGLSVHMLSDCTAGRTRFEQDFYCREIFPLYAEVLSSHELIDRIGTPPNSHVSVRPSPVGESR